MTTTTIGGSTVGDGAPCFIIAELSGNHGGSLARAKEVVLAAAAAGADAVKLQHYTADMLTLESDEEPFRLGSGTIWDGQTLHDLYQEAATPWEWTEELFATAEEAGIQCLSTPFGPEAVRFLERFDPPAHKIASFEAIDLDLVRSVASAGRTVIASTGLCSLSDIDDLVQAVRSTGNGDLVLLRCNSSYPANHDELDLRTIPHMRETWNVPVGLSDHTRGASSAIAAVALGACMIEKHLTLRRSDGGPDAAFSLEPAEFEAMVRGVREAEAAIGRVRYGPSETEKRSLVFRRSLFFVRDIPAGAEITDQDVRSIRPGLGLDPSQRAHIIGRHVRESVRRGTPVSWSVLR